MAESTELVHEPKDLQGLIEALNEASQELQPLSSRSAKRSEWATKRELDNKEKEVVQSLTYLVGSGNTAAEGALDEDDVAILMDETVAIRTVQDILEGRYKAIREALFTHFDHVSGEGKPGDVASDEHGKRFAREMTGGAPYVDWSTLESVLPSEVWTSVTDEVIVTTQRFDPSGEKIDESRVVKREPNEDRVLKAVDDGRISMEHLAQATKTTKQVARFQIRSV